MKHIKSLFLVLLGFLFLYGYASSTNNHIVITNINSKKFKEISIPKLHDVYRLGSPVIISEHIRKDFEYSIYKLRKHYIYTFGQSIFDKQILPASSVILIAVRLKDIVTHSSSSISLDISGNIETPKKLNPLMKDTLCGYVTSDQSGGIATFAYYFK